MISYAAFAAALSSTTIRVLAYVFFRWVDTPSVACSLANVPSIDPRTPAPSNHLHGSTNLHHLVHGYPNP